MPVLATVLGLSLLGSFGGLLVASSLLLFNDNVRRRLVPGIVAPARFVTDQRAHRVARALDAPGLEQVRDCKQERHRRRLGPLPDRGRANRRHADQHVHVDPAEAQ